MPAPYQRQIRLEILTAVTLTDRSLHAISADYSQKPNKIGWDKH